MPKVSVIMPAYNAEKYIREAIESVLSQTFRDFELIVINDCSRDSTESVILSFSDSRIVYVKNEENMGVAATLNRGLCLAQGEYIARMDADDISLSERFAKQVAYLDAHSDIAVLGTNVETFDENGPLYTGWSATKPKQMGVDLFFSCGLAHPSVMMRKSVVLGLGGYDLDFEGLEDYQLWCRVAESYGVTTLPDILFRYRVHGGQVTKNPSDKYLARMRRLKRWQLEELGLSGDIQGTEAYFQLCLGKPPKTKEEILELACFFEAVLAANHTAGRYDEAMLEDSFRGVLLSATAQLGAAERKAICRGTKLISSWLLRCDCLKKKLRKLLGR